jgi:hypothetical protein
MIRLRREEVGIVELDLIAAFDLQNVRANFPWPQPMRA